MGPYLPGVLIIYSLALFVFGTRMLYKAWVWKGPLGNLVTWLPGPALVEEPLTTKTEATGEGVGGVPFTGERCRPSLLAKRL